MQRIRELARSSQRHRHLAIEQSVKHHHIRIIEFSSSFFDNIIFSVQSAKKRKRGKRQISARSRKEGLRVKVGEAEVRFFITQADSRGREREREKGREWLGEWESGWGERDRARGHASGRWEDESQRDRYINIYTHAYTEERGKGERRKSDEYTYVYALASCTTCSEQKSSANLETRLRKGYTREK